MAATPAAEPMMSMLPPVPAAYAMKCHKWSSIGLLYIPMAAATSGTLSMIADNTPSNMMMMFVLGIAAVRLSAPLLSKLTSPTTTDSKAAMAINIPKKNRILEISILDNALCGE